MKKNDGLKTRIVFGVVWFFSLAAFAYAVEPTMLSREAGEDRSVRGVPVTESDNSENGTLPSNPTSPSPDSVALSPSVSPVVYETPLVSTPTPAPDEKEISATVDDISSRMAGAGLREEWSQVLTYIGSEDYTGLTDFQKEHPEIFNKLSDLLRDISDRTAVSGTFSGHSVSKDYADHWLEEVKRAQEILSNFQTGVDNPDLLAEAMKKLYQPVAKRISKMAQSLEEAGRVLGDHGDRELPSGSLLQNFSAKAKKFIWNSFDQAQTNLANGMLSGSFEATAFGAETAAVQGSSAALDPTSVREMTLAEMYVKNRQYRVVDSVYIGKDFIYAQKMLHPPADLHPYLKWLLYTRNLTPRMVERYLATREAVGAIYEQAKAGQGNIRYKDKVYGAFLPFAVTAAGNYELVKSASAE